MKAAPLAIVICLAVAAIAASAFVMPGAFESMTMLSRDQRGEAAVAVGNQARRNGDRDPAFLNKLIDLNREYGDSVSEAAALDDYLMRYPDDLGVLRKAAGFYENMQDIDALTATLEKVAALSKQPADIEKLARLYRAWGEFAAERKLLYAHREATLSQSMAVRLADYLLRDKKPEEAARILERVVDLPGTDRREARTLLFDALVHNGEPDEAGQHAARWVRADLEPSQQAIFVLTLAIAGADDAARSLAGVLPSRPSGSSGLAWMLASEGRIDLARVVVNEWMTDADPQTALKAARLYVDMAGSVNNFGPVYTDIHTGLTSPDKHRTGRAMMMTRIMYERYGYDAIAGVRPLLSGDLLARQPLLAASLANVEKNPSATRYFLFSTDLAHIGLDEAERWTELAKANFGAAELAQELASRWRSGRLAPALMPYFRQVAVRSGQQDPAFAGRRRSFEPESDRPLKGSVG